MAIKVSLTQVSDEILRARIYALVAETLGPRPSSEDWGVLVCKQQTGHGWDVGVRGPGGRWFSTTEAVDDAALSQIRMLLGHAIDSARHRKSGSAANASADEDVALPFVVAPELTAGAG